MKIELLTLAVRIAALVITGIIAPALKGWLESRAEDARIERIKGFARQAVSAAEQIHKKAMQDDPDGTRRKELAKQILDRMGLKAGIALSASELDDIIEAAVYDLNLENK